MSNQLTFQTTTFNVIEQHNQIWLTSTELAKALGYANVRSISKIYNANADEFSEQMTMITEMVIDGINNTKRKIQQRIFSLRGCHLIAMFSQTEIAKDFRKWVLDILDKEVLQNTQPNRPFAEEPEVLNLLVQSYHFLYEAKELRDKAYRTVIGVDIDKHLGGHYLHNLGLPLKQHLEKIQDYIHKSSERIMFVKGMLSLLDEPKTQPKRIADF